MGWSSSGGWGRGLMRGIKIPQQNFALKMQGGCICGTLRYMYSKGTIEFLIIRTPPFCSALIHSYTEKCNYGQNVEHNWASVSER